MNQRSPLGPAVAAPLLPIPRPWKTPVRNSRTLPAALIVPTPPDPAIQSLPPRAEASPCGSSRTGYSVILPPGRIREPDIAAGPVDDCRRRFGPSPRLPRNLKAGHPANRVDPHDVGPTGLC